MRVLQVFNQHRGHAGGGGKIVADTIASLREKGHEVEVFTKSSEALPKNAWGRFQAAASIVAAPESIREFTSLLDRFAPDLIHAYELFPLVSPWILPLCTARRIPVVLTPIDYRLTCPVVTHLYREQVCTKCCGGHEYWATLRNCRGNLAESIAVSAYNTIVRQRGLFRDHVTHYAAPSSFTRQFLIQQLAIPPARISVNYPLVDLAQELPAADPRGGRYIAFAGRFTSEKGVHVALAAARLSGLPMRLARNVDARAELEVPPEWEVVTRGREDLIEFYRGARMVIVPSIWFETFGLVPAEAMSLGLPVIVSRIGALAELVEDGVDGLHCAPGDPADLARKIMLLWHDPALLRRLGAGARRKATSTWTRQEFGNRLLGIYATAVEQCRTSVQYPDERNPSGRG